MYCSAFKAAAIIVAIVAFAAIACSPGSLLSGDAVQVPDRDVPASPEAAAQAITALNQAQGGGTIRLTEAQFTSLIAEPVRQSDAGLLLEDLTVWFEPETVYLRARSKGEELPIKGKVVMSGGLAVNNGKLTLSLEQARAAGVGVPDAALNMLNGELNRRIRLLDALNMPVRTLQVESGAVLIQPSEGNPHQQHQQAQGNQSGAAKGLGSLLNG
jgi:hypothetical protein